MQIIVVQSGLYVTAIAVATTIIGIRTYIYALNLTYVYGYCYVYIHTYMRYNS
jgi:hypothetical protein